MLFVKLLKLLDAGMETNELFDLFAERRGGGLLADRAIYL